VVLFSICTLFLAVRLYAKKFRGNGFWWDDWIVFASWVRKILIYSRLMACAENAFSDTFRSPNRSSIWSLASCCQ